MRLASFILLVGLHLSARTVSQTVTLSGTGLKLEAILAAIRQQTGYTALYDKDALVKAVPVSVNVNNRPLESFLKEVFKNQPLNYTIKKTTILIRQKEVTGTPDDKNDGTVQEMLLIKGIVRGEDGRPLTGATVKIRGTGIGTTTDASGSFALNALKGQVIVISYIGYEVTEIRIKDQLSLNVQLSIAKAAMQEIVVNKGYYTESQLLSVGSVAKVTAEEIAKQPVNNILLTLQGRVPGLVVTPNSGAPGASVRIQVRGQNTLQSNLNSSFMPYDQPLFIIDGVPFAPQNNRINLSDRFGANTAHVVSTTTSAADGMSPFNSINPADIESVTILKDADATSIYGSQGSNGVILITTKKGKPGKTSLEVRVDRSVNAVTRPLQMLNTPQYLDLRREAIKNDGIPDNMITSASFPDLTLFDQNKYTNWYREFFGRTSNNTNAYVTLTGGAASTSFIFTGGYTHSPYNFPGDFADKRVSLHSAIHHSALEDRLTFDFGTDYSYDNNNSSGAPNVASVFVLPPNLPDLLDAAGNLVWSYKGVQIDKFQQYGYLKQPADLQAYNLNTVLNIGYKIVKGLRVSANMGYSRIDAKETGSQPLSSQSPAFFSFSTATFGSNIYQTLSIEPQLDYRLTIGKSAFSALAGGSFKKNLSNDVVTMGTGYSSDALLGSINGATTITSSDNSNIYKYIAAFGRLNYVYDRKYIVNLTGRRDGSSNFGVDRQFGNFGSAGLGWIFSEENGFKTAIPFISLAKFSGSYGTSGSDGIAPYLYQAFWQPNTNVNPFQGTRPYEPYNLYNPDYSWSVKKTWNIALDLGVFDNRITVNTTWYQSRSDNQLVNYALPAQTGFASVLQNFNATVQNTGLEFTITSTNSKSKNFTWTTNLNFSVNRNKLVAFPGLESSSYASYYTVGKSTNIVNGYKYKDVNPTTGLFEFYDAKGQATSFPAYGIVSQGGDMLPIADLQARWTGGLNNTLSYKNFSLTVFFQFAKQTAPSYLSDLYGSGDIPGGLSNIPVQALDHWKNPGDVSKLQRVSTGTYSYDPSDVAYTFSQSSGAYADASYIRVKTASLEYRLPETRLKRAGIKSLRFFINAQNLLTITGYKVTDPESKGSLYSFPLQRTIAGGLSFNF